MKYSFVKNWFGLFIVTACLALSWAKPAFGVSACPITFSQGNVLTGQVGQLVNYPNSDAYFDTVVQGVNQPLLPGTYLTWCVDEGTAIDPSLGSGIFTGTLFADCDPNLNSELPPGHSPTSYVSPAVWQQVNYILNHKNGAYFWNIQIAINTLVGGPPPVFPPIPYNPTIVHSLLTAASNNAPTWTPQCGDVAGVVWAITNEVGLPLTGPVQLLLLEVPIQCVVTGGDTATIGFWHNKNGQALIDSFNGGPTSTKLGTWLAANYGCLFGNLNGQPNTVVAAQFLAYFSVTGQKTYAQIMAGALAAYATSSTLAGGAGAAGYGFNVSATGTGAKTYNTGSNGTAIGLANNTSYTVFQLLQAANSSCPLSAAAFNALNNIFSGINQTGDIQ